MKKLTKSSLAPIVVALFLICLLFGGGAMSGGTMTDGKNANGLIVERSWMWAPALFTLGFGVVVARTIIKKAVRPMIDKHSLV